jgi:hypothetical protein
MLQSQSNRKEKERCHNNDNLFYIHNGYTGTIGQVSWKQTNTTCQQLLKNAQDNVQYNPLLINIPLL